MDLRELARYGAAARITELQGEIDAIRREFPDAVSSPNGAARQQRGPRKRRKMSAAARKRISEAQKARWAAQKKGTAKGTAKAATK